MTYDFDAVQTFEMQAFNLAYVNSQPPGVRKLIRMYREGKSEAERYAYARTILAGQNPPAVDILIHLIGYAPFVAMALRLATGHMWILSAEQEDLPNTPQGYSLFGKAETGPIPPRGMIVSVNLIDFPPYDDLVKMPKPFRWRSKAAAGADPNGVGSLWNPIDSSDIDSEGIIYSEGAAKYRKTLQAGWMGLPIVFWERVA